jgi:DNA-binding MarR family transcriptional regulator
MHELFSAEPVRLPARRGQRTMPMRRAPRGDCWPPHDRDPNDVALVAARLLVASGRLGHRLNATARKYDVDPYVFRLLLLFAEHDRELRIGNIAELLNVSQATATRVAARAYAAGLVDKFTSPIDGREVDVGLSYPGRAAVGRCLDAIRSDASEVLGLGPLPTHSHTSEGAGHRAGIRAGLNDQ